MGKKEVVLASDIVLRLTIPLFLWQNPVLTAIIVTLVEASDGLTHTIFGLEREIYQKVDKILDHYFFTIVMIYLWKNPLFYIFLAFYLLRLCGVVLLSITRNEEVLLFFPNVIEFIFFLYIFTLCFPRYSWLLSGKMLHISIGVLAAVKIMQEYVLHVKRFFLSKWVLEKLGFLGLTKKITPRGESDS